MTVRIGKVETFPDVKPSKEQALKVMEEAAEVFGAWQAWDTCVEAETIGNFPEARAISLMSERLLLDECADVIQATCNLLAAFDVEDFREYMQACAERNRERGRM